MALVLPRISVALGGGPARAATRSAQALHPGELTHLLGFDEAAGEAFAERCVPLSPDEQGRRWAVGRRFGDQVVWRIVDQSALHRLSHPAWLWTRDDWFDLRQAETARIQAPAALSLRHLVQLAQPLSGNRRRSSKALAATVAALRARLLDPSLEPVAVLASPQALVSASTPGRYFLLALLTLLPPDLRERLRVGWGEITPDPERFDLVVCSGRQHGARTLGPSGFRLVDAIEPPSEGEDLVAYYIRNRLNANDPEAIEAAAHLEAGGPEARLDPWGAGIAELLREGLPGISAVDPERIARDAEGAVRAMAARLRAGATLDDGLLNDLILVTLATRDPRPWAPLGERPAVVRARAVRALLDQAQKFKPRSSLVQVLGALYPPGAELEPWVQALMRWIRAGSDAALQVLEQTLLSWPSPRTRATRASVWSEVVRLLVSVKRYDAAQQAVVSPLARELAQDGAGRALVGNWSAIPAEHRSPERLGELVEILAGAKDSGPAIAMLFRYVRESPAEVATLVRRWTDLRGTTDGDPLLEAIRSSDYVGEWIAAAIARGAPHEVGELVQRWARGPDDPVWGQAEELLAAEYGDDPRNRFVALHALSPGLVALEPRAQALIGPAIAATRYPDYELAEVACALVEVPGASSLWGWIALTANVPDRFDDGTVDATTVAFCADPPDLPLQEVALASARALGLAERWEVIDHARWIVRLCLAPDDGTRFHLALAQALVQGICLRQDAVARMAEITNMLLDLEPDHPALDGFICLLLPHAWLGGLPRLYVEAVARDRLPPPLVATWQELVR